MKKRSEKNIKRYKTKKVKPTIKHPKKYQKNKYFPIVVIIVILNLLFFAYIGYNFISKQGKIEKQIATDKKKQMENIDILKIKELNNLDDLDKQISYLDNIKSGDEIKVNDIDIIFPKISNKINSDHFLSKSKFVPKVKFDDNFNNELSNYILNKNYHDIEIDSPNVTNNKIELKWTSDEYKNKNISDFMSSYLSNKNNEFTFDLNSNENSFWNTNIPYIYKIKFLTLILEKYDINNVKINLEKVKDINSCLDALYIVQKYVEKTKSTRNSHTINFDFILNSINTSYDLSLDNSKLVESVLKHNLNLNSFILNYSSPVKQIVSNRVDIIKNNIAQLKWRLKDNISKYKKIELEDDIYNSFISLNINSESTNIPYSTDDVANITQLYKDYNFQSLYLNNLNIDYGISNQRSMFKSYLYFTNRFQNVLNSEKIDRKDVYKIFTAFTKPNIDYKKMLNMNKNDIEELNLNKEYKRGDYIKIANRVYIYNNDVAIRGYNPLYEDTQNPWKFISSYDDFIKNQDKVKIEIKKHNGVSLEMQN